MHQNGANSYIEKESSGKSAGKFFTQTTRPRSEVVFFMQIFVTLVLITLCIVILGKLESNCEKSSVWISILSSLIGCSLPNPRLWINLYLRKIGSSWPL